MNAPRPRPSAAVGTVHPVVLERRIRDILLTGLSALIPGVLALGICLALPEASLLLVLGVIAAAVGIMALIVSSRLEVTVALLAVYLGMLDGPVKLFLGAHEVTASVRNVLILAVCAGALMRLTVRRERISLPPLSGWVFAWVAVVLLNAFNPKTEGILHTLGGFRQLLEFVPFFFFGYVLMRSKRRFQQFFIVLGVLAVANGLVAAYQTELSPAQLASWGPGYHNLIFIPENEHGGARIYVSEGEGRVRPPGLGSDQGFSGGVGHIALPACLALLITARRRKWLAALLCLGAMLAVVVGLGREGVIAAVLGVIAFTGLAALSGRSVSRALAGMLAVVVLAIPAGALLVSTLRSGTFSRYESIGTSSSTTAHKEAEWDKLPKLISASPFGFGLGSAGPVAGFGGRLTDVIEGHGVGTETEYNLLQDELGVPGLILWPALVIYVIVLVGRGMRRVGDGDLAIDLAGAFAAFLVFPIEATVGPLTPSAASGPYFWFAIGIAAYWFAGPGRAHLGARLGGSDAQLATR
jgi:hypothetical protein